MTAALDVNGLDKTIAVGFFGRPKRILHGVTFSVARGQTVGFVGVNGAGKSTTIKHLVGASRPTRGTVRVLGGDPRSPSARRAFGYMPELPPLPATLTGRELFGLHAALSNAPSDGPKARALIESVGLAERFDERVGGYSKGMQTRLTLALALLAEPEVLILDEPMSGLDPVGRRLVKSVIREQGNAGRTILFSSHVLADVEALCSHVIVIDAGKIVFAGSAEAAAGGSADRYVVRVADPGQEPAGAGVLAARREAGTWVLVIQAPDGAAAASAAAATGATVISVEPERPSLEERVLHLMQRSAS